MYEQQQKQNKHEGRKRHVKRKRPKAKTLRMGKE